MAIIGRGLNDEEKGKERKTRTWRTRFRLELILSQAQVQLRQWQSTCSDNHLPFRGRCPASVERQIREIDWTKQQQRTNTNWTYSRLGEKKNVSAIKVTPRPASPLEKMGRPSTRRLTTQHWATLCRGGCGVLKPSHLRISSLLTLSDLWHCPGSRNGIASSESPVHMPMTTSRPLLGDDTDRHGHDREFCGCQNLLNDSYPPHRSRTTTMRQGGGYYNCIARDTGPIRRRAGIIPKGN